MPAILDQHQATGWLYALPLPGFDANAAQRQYRGIESAPCLVVEVLSDSTVQTNLSDKLNECTALPSLERYSIISQTSKLVLVYARQSDGWRLETLEHSGEVYIACLDTHLSLEQIYQGLAFTMDYFCSHLVPLRGAHPLLRELSQTIFSVIKLDYDTRAKRG